MFENMKKNIESLTAETAKPFWNYIRSMTNKFLLAKFGCENIISSKSDQYNSLSWGNED
jgi:hypothetical protein